MKLCIFGNKTTTKGLLDELMRIDVEIDYLVTLTTDQAKAAKISGRDDELSEFAAYNRIPIFNPDSYSLKSDTDISFFQKQHFDLGLCTGWQRIIPRSIIDSFKDGIFGWHGSGFELPNGRGRSPLNWSLRLGLPRVYHNLFRYAYGADDGMVYETEVIPIEPTDYISDLQIKALQHMKQSAVRLIRDITKGSLQLTEQSNHPYIQLPSLNEAAGTIYPKQMRCQHALNIIRSCSKPFPGALLEYEGKTFRIWRATTATLEMEKTQDVFVSNDSLFIRLRDGHIVSDEFEIF